MRIRDLQTSNKAPLLHEQEEIQQLDEVNMSPAALADFAKTPFAQSMMAGFEAELSIPDASSGYEEEQEPDYDYDGDCNSTREIRDFFQGDYNSRRDIDRAIEQIDEEFFEYADERIMDDFQENESEYVRTAILDDNPSFSKEEVQEIMDDPDTKQYQKYRDEAWEAYRDEADYDMYIRGFFRRNYPRMSSIESNFGLTWPHWTSGESEDGDIKGIADDIASSIGMPVKPSSGYHGAKRGPGYFILEPDSSIESDRGDAGLELISPPMPLAQALEYLDKVFEWANSRGCSTNESTGFHMGISIPGQTLQNVDHLKFTLFLGDDYVLKQFGRESNSYAKSMMKDMARKIKNMPDADQAVPEILASFNQGMNTRAADTWKRKITKTHDRYVTVNIKENYIEVRSAGGDYIGDVEKIKNTLLRYVRAMGLAADPEAEKQEYAKKLYKFLSPMIKGEEDVIKYFSQFSAGMMPKKGLVGLLRQAQQKRSANKDKANQVAIGEGPNLYQFRYYPVNTDSNFTENTKTVEVRGSSRRDATANFRKKFSENEYNIYSIGDIEITDDSQAAAVAQQNRAQAQDYQIRNNNGGIVGFISAYEPAEAVRRTIDWARNRGQDISQLHIRSPAGDHIPIRRETGGTASSQSVYRMMDSLGVLAQGTFSSTVAAEQHFADRARAMGLPQRAWRVEGPVIAPYSSSPAAEPPELHLYEIVRISDDWHVHQFMARNDQQAHEITLQYLLPRVTNPAAYAVRRSGQETSTPASEAGTYIIDYRNPQGVVATTALDANNRQEAADWFHQHHPGYRIIELRGPRNNTVRESRERQSWPFADGRLVIGNHFKDRLEDPDIERRVDPGFLTTMVKKAAMQYRYTLERGDDGTIFVIKRPGNRLGIVLLKNERPDGTKLYTLKTFHPTLNMAGHEVVLLVEDEEQAVSEAKKTPKRPKTIIDGAITTLKSKGRSEDEAIADLKKEIDRKFYTEDAASADQVNKETTPLRRRRVVESTVRNRR